MADYDVRAILSVKDSGFTSSMESAISTLDKLDTSADTTSNNAVAMGTAFGVASKLISAAFSAIQSSMGNAISRFDTLNQFPKVMEQIGFSAEDAAAASEKLVAGIQGLPTSLDEITANTQSIALLTGDLDEATDIALALNDAFLASGSSSYDASRGLAQYSQMLAAGTVDMQSWRVLLETMGVALNDVAAEFGYTGESAKNDLYTALKSGEITFDELNATLINLDNGLSTASDSFVAFSERALTGSEGIATSFQNIKTAITTGLANMLTAIDTALGDAGLGSIASNLDSLKVAVKNAFSVINSVISGVVKVIAPLLKTVADNMDTVALVAGTLAAKFAALKIIDTVKTMMEKFKSSTKEAYSVIKDYNDALEKYGSKAKAAKTAEEALEKAQEASTKAAKAQKDADDALVKSKEKYAAALKAEMELEQTVKKYGKESTEAAEAATAAKEAQIAASEAKAAAVEKEAVAEQLATTATEQAVVAEEAGAAASTLNNTQISLKTALLGVLSGETSIAEAAQLGLNTAMESNPAGMWIAAITTLITVIGGLVTWLAKGSKEMQEFREEQEEIRDSLEETREEVDENTESTRKNIAARQDEAAEIKKTVKSLDTIKTAIDRANAAGSDTTTLTNQLKTAIAEVNGYLGEGTVAYDEETNAISQTTDALMALVNAEQLQSEVDDLTALKTEYHEQYIAALAEEKAAEEELAEAEAQVAEIDAKRAELAANEVGMNQVLGRDRDEQLAKIEELTETKEKAAEMTQYYSDLEAGMADEITAKTNEMTAAEEAAFAQLVDDYGVVAASMTDMTEAQETALDRLVDAYGTMTSGLSDLTRDLVGESKASFDEMMLNQDSVIDETIEFAELYGQALENGLTESWLSALGITDATALPEMRAIVEEINEEGIDAVLEKQSNWEDAYSTIGSTFADSLQMTDQDKATIQEYITGTSGVLGTLQSAIEAADWKSEGEAITEGITWGITGSERNVTDATIGVATDSINGYEGEIKSGSPSKVFMEFGEAEMEGLALGITENADQAVSALEDVVTQSAEAFEGSSESYTAIGEAIASGIASGIQSQSKTVSTAISAIVTDVQKLLNAVNLSAYGSNAITTYVSGLTNVKSKVTSLVSTLIAEVKNAFNAVSLTSYGTNAITSYYSGMNSVKSKVTTLISTLITDIKNKLNAVSLTSYGKNAITSYASGMESKISSVKSQSQAAANAAKSGVENLSLYSYGANAMQGFINGMESKRSAVQSKASSIANAAASTISSALKIGSPSKLTKKYGKWTAEGLAIGIAKGEGKVENEVEDLASVVQSLADVVDVTSSIKEAFSGLSTTLASSGVDAIQGFVSGVKSMQAAVTEVADVTSTVKTAFASLSTTLTSSGVSAIQGFIDGMKSMQQAVTSTALSLAQCASSAISAALKIGSPSKLLRQYGEWTGEGFELGLESTISGIKDVARDIADTAVEFLTPSTSTWDFGELAIAGGMTFGVDSLSDDIARLTEALNSRPIQVETSLEIDGREFATATSGYISDEIDRTQARASRKSGVK